MGYNNGMKLFAYYSYMHHVYRSHGHVSGHWLGLIILAILLILSFELWMLIDVITNKKVPTRHKVWWAVGMFLIHPIVAIVYFFVSRLHYNKLKHSKS